MADDRKYTITFQSKGVVIELGGECFEDKQKHLAALKKEIADRKIDQADLTVIERAFSTENTNPLIFAPPQPEPVDGKVQVRLSKEMDRVEIKVDPPMGKGRKAELRDVMDAIKDAGAGTFYLDVEKIESMLSSFRFRDFVPVGEKRDGRFDVVISRDLTEATLTIAPPFGGEPVRITDIIQHFKNERICHGIKGDILKKMIDDQIFNQAVVVAVGEKPVDGNDSTIEFFFDHTSRRAKPQINDEGEIDYRELNLFQSIKKGEPVARKVPFNPGMPGKTIYGTEIKAKTGRDIPSPIGLNCKADDRDPSLIVAAVDGQPKFMNNKINIVPMLEIPGDVDFSTGNINFTGSVNIRGSVTAGFSVKAMGDISIGGLVDMCTIECGGNLHIRQGIVGQEKAMIICRGNLFAKFADKATIFSEGNVYIDESLLFCTTSSAGEVFVMGKKGYIMGGVTRASKSVTANRIGTPTQTPTLIEVGGSPSLRAEMEKMEEEIRTADEKSQTYNKNLESLEKLRSATGGALSEEQKQKVLHLSRERFALLARLRAFREKKEDLEEKLSRVKGTHLRVNVKEKTMPGAKIVIKNAIIVVQDSMDFTTFYERDNEIQIAPFSGSTEIPAEKS